MHRSTARRAKAQAALAELNSREVTDVLLEEIDRRRLDEHGNPTDPPGLYDAVATALLAILGQLPSRKTLESARELGFSSVDEQLETVALAERLAAVGRGVQLRSKIQDHAPAIREIASLVEAMVKSKLVPPEQKPGALARTLAKRWEREVDEEAMALAIAKKSRNGRVTAVTMALGLIHGASEREVLDRVRDALKPR